MALDKTGASQETAGMNLPDVREVLTDLASDLLACLRFYSRLPIPPLGFERNPHGAEISARVKMLPFAGALIGAVAALLMVLATQIGLPVQLAAVFAIVTLIVVTGAFHEDGLADFADAMGGNAPEQRLAIMKDSRIGSFGTLALMTSLLLRIFSVAIVARHNLLLAALVLIATAAVSRTLALLPLVLLPPARMEGAGFSARSDQPPLRIAALAAFVLSLLPWLAGASLGRILTGLLLSILGAYGVTALARRLIGGQTGDVAGAAQQAAEIAAYLVFAAR
ncbi:adenosylcobinamide-GDP ribazoletransferase [uncultured Methylovirgula sp.]|uniref:adenosylcobinamide-GDP ribazoletransferase n=1 Tax=uncultured Methylovirgula sp. TaxID=1285960 RepID=UPI00263902FC|nr:adenosylcobinamide-GDP ribazoletransferase [uncultured Methylovirgula sp.]